jgi:hypothetical protein
VLRLGRTSHSATVGGLVAAAALALPAIAAAPASATGSYPGETLTVAPNGPDVVGKVGNFVASGQQTDVDQYAGGFDLNVFAKDPTVDSTCAPDYVSEGNTGITEPELRVVVGQWQGPGQTFSVPFKIQFNNSPGPVLLCAYSTWVTDTAAAAVLRFNVVRTSQTPHAGQACNPHKKAPKGFACKKQGKGKKAKFRLVKKH